MVKEGSPRDRVRRENVLQVVYREGKDWKLGSRDHIWFYRQHFVESLAFPQDMFLHTSKRDIHQFKLTHIL